MLAGLCRSSLVQQISCLQGAYSTKVLPASITLIRCLQQRRDSPAVQGGAAAAGAAPRAAAAGTESVRHGASNLRQHAWALQLLERPQPHLQLQQQLGRCLEQPAHPQHWQLQQLCLLLPFQNQKWPHQQQQHATAGPVAAGAVPRLLYWPPQQQKQLLSLFQPDPSINVAAAGAAAGTAMRSLHTSASSPSPTAAAGREQGDLEGAGGIGDDNALQQVLMPRQQRWGKTGALGDLEAALTAAGVPEGAVRAIRAQAPSWPSLSKDPQELLHRIDRLSSLMASRQAAHTMLTSHPQLITRPPAALNQQLINLAAWLRLPLTKPPINTSSSGSSSSSSSSGTSSSSSGSSSSSSSSSSVEPDLHACQQLMDLVQAQPALLFVPEGVVKQQLQDIQALLQLPDPPRAVEDDLAALWTHNPDVLELSAQLRQQFGSVGVFENALSAVADAIDLRAVGLSATLRSEQKQQHKQHAAALAAWRKAQQHTQLQQQQQQQPFESVPLAAGESVAPAANQQQQVVSSSSTRGMGRYRDPDLLSGYDLAAAVAAWPRTLVCQEPEWLFIDTQTELPKKLKVLQQLLLSPASTSSSRKAGGSGTKVKDSQAEEATGSKVSKALSSSSSRDSRKQQLQLQLLLIKAPQLITVDATQLRARLKALRKILLHHLNSLSSSSSCQAGATAAASQPLVWNAVLEELLQHVVLSKRPKLLLQPSKVLEQRAAEIQKQLPQQTLDMLLQLLTQPQLHWQHLEYLQHTQQLPANDPPYSPVRAEAVMQDTAGFTQQFPLFPAWQAAAAAVGQAGVDWRKSWGWAGEFKLQLSGPACHEWLQQLTGRWHRLLLLAAGKPWVEENPAAAWPTVNPLASSSSSSSSSSRKSRRHSSTASSSSSRRRRRSNTAAAAAGASGVSSWPPVSLQQVAAAADGAFPFQPTTLLGPIPLDLPEHSVQRLLLGSKSDLEGALSEMSHTWQHLAAAAAQEPPWQQQLQQLASLLPQAHAAAGWKVPGVQAAAASSSSTNSSSSWVRDLMASRVTDEARAAAAARHAFWQQLQQPGALQAGLQRLQFLHQLGPTAAAAQGRLQQQQDEQQQRRKAKASAKATQIDPQRFWSILAAQESAFLAQFPAFSTWQRLTKLVQDRPAWQEELADLTGMQLLDWLLQANRSWDRLAFLTSGQAGGGEGGMWQAISMADAVAASDAAFVDMFPEAAFLSWQALQDMQSPASASAVLAESAEAADSAAAEGQQAASRNAGRRKPLPDSATAANRLQLLHQYAARYPPWEQELLSWSSSKWADASRLFIQSKLPRMDYFLQAFADNSSSGGGSSSSSGGGGTAAIATDTNQQQQEGQQGGMHVSLLLLLADKRTWCKRLYGGLPMYETWRVLGEAVGAVPMWQAEWRGLRGAELRGLLSDVLSLEALQPEEVRAQAKQQRLRELLVPADTAADSAAAAGAMAEGQEQQLPPAEGEAGGFEADGLQLGAEGLGEAAGVHDSPKPQELSSNGSSGSSRRHRQVLLPTGEQQLEGVSAALQRVLRAPEPPEGFSFTPEALQLRNPGRIELGVTGMARNKAATAAAAGGPGGVSLRPKQRRNRGSPDSSTILAAAMLEKAQQRDPNFPPGVAIAAARLAFFHKIARSAAGASEDLKLRQLLRVPQAELLQAYPKLDPTLEAAKAQGIAEAEAEVLQHLYPGLGPQALPPRVLEGLSPECRDLLAAQPHLLPWLQQFACTSPAWQAALDSVGGDDLLQMLQQMQNPDRVERLQLIARCGLQGKVSLQRVLLLSDKTWQTRFPITQQVAELQAAAKGVTAWERQLARQPHGQELLDTIDTLHKARGRLVWLQQQGAEVRGPRMALMVLNWKEARFKKTFPQYPGDDAMAAGLP